MPAPEVFGEVTLDGRFGIVLGRLDGPTLLQVTRSGAVTFVQAGAIRVPRPVRSQDVAAAGGLPSARLDGHRLQALGDILPKHIASGILALIDRLQQPGTGCAMATSPLKT